MIVETKMDWPEVERALFAALEKTGMLFKPGTEIKQVLFADGGDAVILIDGEQEE